MCDLPKKNWHAREAEKAILLKFTKPLRWVNYIYPAQEKCKDTCKTICGVTNIITPTISRIFLLYS